MIQLEKFELSDYNRLINWIDSEKTMIQFSGPLFTFPITHEQLDNYISAKNRLIFKVIDIATSEIIGHAEINLIDNKNKSARICRVLIENKKNRNQGYGKSIVQKLIKIGFS